VTAAPSYLHAEHYASIVKEMSQRRKLEAAGKQIVEYSWQQETDLDELLSESEAMLTKIQNGGGKVTRDGFQRILDDIASPDNAGVQRVFTGYRAIDSTALGIESGRYWVVAATPGTGKTALQINLVRGVCQTESRVAVLYVHPEQHQTEIATLLITAATDDIRPARLKILRTPATERERYAKALAGINTISKAKIFGRGYDMSDLTAPITDRENKVIRVLADSMVDKITYLDPVCGGRLTGPWGRMSFSW